MRKTKCSVLHPLNPMSKLNIQQVLVISYVGWSFEIDFLLITSVFSKLT